MSCKQCCARAIKLQTLTLENLVESQFALRVRPWRINKQWKGNLVWYLTIIILRDAAFLTFLMHTVIFLLPSFFEQLIRTDYTMSGIFHNIVWKRKYLWYTKIYISKEEWVFEFVGTAFGLSYPLNEKKIESSKIRNEKNNIDSYI